MKLEFLSAMPPEQLGFDSNGIRDLSTLMAGWVEQEQIAGAVAAVVRDNHLAFGEAHGWADRETGKRMELDAIFQLASMTKPIISVAVLRLMDEGKVGLHDPVSKYIPPFSNMRVAVAYEEADGVKQYEPDPDAPAGQRAAEHQGLRYREVPAKREITILDLLTHSSGLGQGEISASKMAMPAWGDTLADYVPRLAELPLDFQPGSQTGYSAMAGFDVLARIVEIASGLALDRYLAQAVFEPLGMADTAFVLTEAQRERMVTMYTYTPEGLVKSAQGEQFPFVGSSYLSGAGGLYGTLADYLRLALMLANSGEWDGKRILQPETVRLMGSSQLPEECSGLPGGQEWGLGVRVITDAAGSGAPLSLGSFGWSGAWGTHFWIDPQARMVAVLLINRANIGGSGAFTAFEFEGAVMRAANFS